jgi:hypothetical protein
LLVLFQAIIDELIEGKGERGADNSSIEYSAQPVQDVLKP